MNATPNIAFPYIGRFAPSPTGPLHFGSLVAALGSWLDARAAGGRWLVRMEDLDRPRCVPGAADTILRQLESYGLTWDGTVLAQSSRDEAYKLALQQLRESGAVYRCVCTRSQLSDAPRNAQGETIYAGTCRGRAVDAHTPHAWRVRAPEDVIRCTDRVFGEIAQSIAAEVGDFVVKRADSLFAYQLAVVVDDAHQHITHIVRGADLLWNTPRQIALQRLLGLPTPSYAHLPLVTNTLGQKLSKQTLAPALPEHDQSQVLSEALGVLGHAPSSMLLNAPPMELLASARVHWRIEAIPTQSTIASTETYT
ncbi:MAG: tRNA glutamyl-Q(34) synthetase GluQRS [Thiobacillus sp.]